MGKKSKLKRLKYQYTRTEFVSAVCAKCRLCKSTSNPEYCYDYVYQDNPKKFMKVILKQLLYFSEWVSDYSKFKHIIACPDSQIQRIFQESFCDSNYCGQLPEIIRPCEHLAGCLHVFRRQIRGINTNNLVVLSDYRKLPSKFPNGNKHDNEIIVVRNPTPTFFCNQGFEKEVKDILNGNDN